MNKNTIIRVAASAAASVLMLAGVAALAPGAYAAESGAAVEVTTYPQPVTVPEIAAPEAGFQGIVAISLDLTGEDEVQEICDPSGDFECVVPLSGLEIGDTDPGNGGIEYRDDYGNLVDPNPAPNPDGIDRSHLARNAVPISGTTSDDNSLGGAIVAASLSGAAVLGTGIMFLNKKTRTANQA